MTDALSVLLRFGAMMLRAGDTAFRVRQAMDLLATRLGIERLGLHITLGGITATAWQQGRATTLATEIAPPGIDAHCIAVAQRIAFCGFRKITMKLSPSTFSRMPSCSSMTGMSSRSDS